MCYRHGRLLRLWEVAFNLAWSVIFYCAVFCGQWVNLHLLRNGFEHRSGGLCLQAYLDSFGLSFRRHFQIFLDWWSLLMTPSNILCRLFLNSLLDFSWSGSFGSSWKDMQAIVLRVFFKSASLCLCWSYSPSLHVGIQTVRTRHGSSCNPFNAILVLYHNSNLNIWIGVSDFELWRIFWLLYDTSRASATHVGPRRRCLSRVWKTRLSSFLNNFREYFCSVSFVLCNLVQQTAQSLERSVVRRVVPC